MNKEEQGSLQKRIYLKDYLEKSSVLSSSYLHKNASGLATPKLLACSQTDVFNKLHSEQNLGFIRSKTLASRSEKWTKGTIQQI